MKLFYKPGACSLSPHIIMREAGLDFSIEKVDLATKVTEHGENFLNINPKGQVPALLLDDNTLLTEGVAIVQYLADKVPDRKLMPATGSITRYHAIEWLNYISTELHKGYVPLFKPDTPEEYKHITIQQLKKQFAYVDGVLSERDYIVGNQFTVADAYLFTVLNWAPHVNIDLGAYANISKYLARIAARPAVNDALVAEGLK